MTDETQEIPLPDEQDLSLSIPEIGVGVPGVELVSLIGQSALGFTFEGVDEESGTRVAVKLLSDPCHAGTFADRFEDQAEHLAGLRHDHLVGCHHAGLNDDGRCYIVSEFIEGPTLDDWSVHRGSIEPILALRMVIDLASGLDYAQEHGLLHRDVKPGNVLLDDRRSGPGRFPYRAKLADLGVLQPTDAGCAPPMAMQGAMAPEQIDDPTSWDLRSDVYGLGCVLFQALTGEPPFLEARPDALRREKEQGLGPNPRKRVPGLDPRLADLIRRMTARDPRRRPQTYDQVVAGCEELVGILRAPRRWKWRRRVAMIFIAMTLGLSGMAWVALRPTAVRVDGPKQVMERERIVLTASSGALAEPAFQWRLLGADQWPDLVLGDLTHPELAFTAPESREDYALDFEVSARETVGEGLAGSRRYRVTVRAKDDLPSVTEVHGPPTAVEGGTIILTGGATDAEGDEVGYQWALQAGPSPAEEIPSGPTVTLIAPKAKEPYAWTFALVVNDGEGRQTTTGAELVMIQVDADDDPPAVTFEPYPTIAPGDEVRLRGIVIDEEGVIPTTRWEQRVTGFEPVIEETLIFGAEPSFPAPQADDSYTLTFDLVARDESGDGRGSLEIRVEVANEKPTVSAPERRYVSAGREMRLAGDGIDPEGARMHFEWRQVGGPGEPLELMDADTSTVTFTPPDLGEDYELELELAARDGKRREPITARSVVKVFTAGKPLAPGIELPLFGSVDGGPDSGPGTWTRFYGEGELTLDRGNLVIGDAEGTTTLGRKGHLPGGSWVLKGELSLDADPERACREAELIIEPPRGIGVAVRLTREGDLALLTAASLVRAGKESSEGRPRMLGEVPLGESVRVKVVWSGGRLQVQPEGGIPPLELETSVGPRHVTIVVHEGWSTFSNWTLSAQ